MDGRFDQEYRADGDLRARMEALRLLQDRRPKASATMTDAPPPASLARIFVAILSSRPAQRIHFRLGGITVDGSGLVTVASLIARGAEWRPGILIDPGPAGIRIYVDPSLDAPTGAAYDQGGMIIKVPKPSFGRLPWERMFAVHEAVHAMHHVLRGPLPWARRGNADTPRTENEAAAYVAGALFALYDDGQVYKDRPGSQIYTWANHIAAQIKDRPGAVVALAFGFGLRAAIMRNPSYKGVSFNEPN